MTKPVVDYDDLYAHLMDPALHDAGRVEPRCVEDPERFDLHCLGHDLLHADANHEHPPWPSEDPPEHVDLSWRLREALA